VIARVKLRTFAGATTIFCNSNPQSIVSPDEPAAINSRDHSATEEAILPNHAETLRSTHALDASDAYLGHHLDAIKLYAETLTFERSTLGPDHPQNADDYE